MIFPDEQLPAEYWATVWKDLFDVANSMNIIERTADFYLLLQTELNYPVTTDDFYKYTFYTNTDVSDAYNDLASRCHPMHAEILSVLSDTVTVLDKALFDYTRMTIGGEFRHTCEGDTFLSCNRELAWGQWFAFQEQLKPDDYLTIGEIFCKNKNGETCGKQWEFACIILHGRLTGTFSDVPFINKKLFVDRILSLQHNTGNFVNKIGWQGFSEDGMSTVLDAHQQNPPDVDSLLGMASENVRRLYHTWKVNA